MKKSLLYTIAFIFIVIYNVYGTTVLGPAETVAKYYDAARQGDVVTMKELIAGPFYKSRKALLEKNVDYSRFLKDYFTGVNVQVNSPSIGNENMVAVRHPNLYQRHYVDYKGERLDPSSKATNHLAVVKVLLKFTAQQNLSIKLLLDQDVDGKWKIVDEVLGH